MVLREDDGTNTQHYVHGLHGVHAVNDGAAWTYPLQDGLNSVRGYVGANNTGLSNVNYTPIGVPDTNIVGPAFTGEWRDETEVQYHRARYLSPNLGVWLSLDPFEGLLDRPMSLNGYSWVEGNIPNDAVGELIFHNRYSYANGNPANDAVGELIFHNRYSYANGNPVNLTDSNGMCPRREESPDAMDCEQLRNQLASWGVKVYYDQIANIPCVPGAVNQAQTTAQRFKYEEMLAIYRAFRIFAEAHGRFRNLNTANFISNQPEPDFNYDYNWPLTNPITIEKRRYAGWENVNTSTYTDDPASSANPIGIHYYSGGNAETTRKIVMSAYRWGAENNNMTAQSRSWLVLHEFAHIFSRDRLTARCGDYESAERQLLSQATLPRIDGGLDFTASGGPTQYSTPPAGVSGSAPRAVFGQEYYTEAITGTIWNYGWNAVSGYTNDAGGWYRENVLNIVGNDGARLFTWVLNNVIGLTSCPV